MRTINFVGDINQSSIPLILEKIFEFEEEDNKKLKAGDTDLEPVVFNISSDGGFVHVANAVYDAIKNLKCKIITRAWGECSSSAIRLFLLGDERLIGASTTITWHPLSYCVHLNVYSQKSYNEFNLEMQKRLDDLLIEKTNITKEMLKKHSYNDWYIFPEEAIELGLAHRII